jgi:NAD(P)-dependent dehydrogenase (short-subunit alcohol dehydrogenase family)
MGEKDRREPTYDFHGKVALVTGAAGGIGRVIALAFARQGASVAVADVNVQGGEETVRLIREADGAAEFIRADVSKEDDVRNLVASAVERYGNLDFACNNAGIEGAQVPIAELPTDRWDQTVAINLTGVFQCLKYELQQMLKQGSGAIVNIASVASFLGTPARAGYVATKHGIVGLTKTAALEVATKGIRVNAVAPGLVNAGLTDAAPREFIEVALAAQPIGRMAEAEEIAAAVLWLCSDAASFVLGQTLPVEGGFTIAP